MYITKKQAAINLDISAPTLDRWAKELGINKKRITLDDFETIRNAYVTKPAAVLADVRDSSTQKVAVQLIENVGLTIGNNDDRSDMIKNLTSRYNKNETTLNDLDRELQTFVMDHGTYFIETKKGFVSHPALKEIKDIQRHQRDITKLLLDAKQGTFVDNYTPSNSIESWTQ